MNKALAVNWVIETKIDESFSERYEPVSLNMYVMKLIMVRVPLRNANNSITIAIKSDFLACGVPTNKEHVQITIDWCEQSTKFPHNIFTKIFEC